MTGGDHAAVDEVLADPRLKQLTAVGPWLAVPDPRRASSSRQSSTPARRGSRSSTPTCTSVAAMWQPEPGWLALPGGSGASTVGVWRTVLGDQPVAVKRLSAPVDGDPPELSNPRHFAYWRRAGRRAHRRHGPGDARPALGPPRRDRGGRRGDHALPGVGRGRLDQRAVRRSRAGPVRGRAARGGAVAARATCCATGWPGSSGTAAGGPWRGPRWPTWPTTSGSGAASSWRLLDALVQVPQHGDADAGQPARRATGTTCSRSTGRRSAPGRSAPIWATTRSPPARSSIRCWRPICWGCRTGLATVDEVTLGRAGHRGLHRPQPRRVGAGPGGQRGGRAGGQVPAPRGRAAPARAAASLHPHRGAGRELTGSECSAGEGVAGLEGALAVAGEEPLHPRLRRAVGPRLRVDVAAGGLLDPVVADGRGRVDRLLDVVARSAPRSARCRRRPGWRSRALAHIPA